jgi:hypothetical protein
MLAMPIRMSATRQNAHKSKKEEATANQQNQKPGKFSRHHYALQKHNIILTVQT